jgi:hypothetical protein
MVFSQSVVEGAWERSRGRCECVRQGHGHDGRCKRPLLWSSRGSDCDYGWEAHRIRARGSDRLSNCEILCHACCKQTDRNNLQKDSLFVKN